MSLVRGAGSLAREHFPPVTHRTRTESVRRTSPAWNTTAVLPCHARVRASTEPRVNEYALVRRPLERRRTCTVFVRRPLRAVATPTTRLPLGDTRTGWNQAFHRSRFGCASVLIPQRCLVARTASAPVCRSANDVSLRVSHRVVPPGVQIRARTPNSPPSTTRRPLASRTLSIW